MTKEETFIDVGDLQHEEVVPKVGEIKRNLSIPEPPPIASHSPAIWALVQKDMDDRDKAGERKYGRRLQAFNGRDALVDAYQEGLDLVVYLRQLIFERDEK